MNEVIKIIFLFLYFLIIKKAKKIEANNLKYKNELYNRRIINDILFINGCDKHFLSQSYRYRIVHQIDQLEVNFIDSSEIYYQDLDPIFVHDFRIIIFYRCPWTKIIEDAINMAKKLNKKVLFDIDDLVIDTKYTDIISFIKSLPKSEKAIYDNGVNLIGKTLKLCEAVITTTEELGNQLKNYVPNIFINHNVANEEMFKLSKISLENKLRKKKVNTLTIGYFSGSISHNSDFRLIILPLSKILREYKNVSLLIAGKLDIPISLKEFSSQIIIKKFVDWKKLPELISNVDINIAPLEENIFNSAKSENKWVEAALLKVPTIASNFGTFSKVIINGKTGLLCNRTEDWYIALKLFITNTTYLKSIGINAYEVVKEKYNSLLSGKKLANYLNSLSNKHIGFVLPSTDISGGIRVILEHSCFLQEEGWDVDLLIPNGHHRFIEFKNHSFNVININNSTISTQYNIIVATLYSTLSFVINYIKVKKKLYLVQGYETDFYDYGNYLRRQAEKTYSFPFGIEYITISKWCQSWLNKKYNHNAKYAPNGIDLSLFVEHKRNLNKNKIRILIEGDNSSPYKNIDESFKIIEKLDKKKFEIWYMSYNARPKKWYQIDKFFNKVPYEEVGFIYYQTDILIKSSWLESFSYPPLEMMATGGYCIVAPNNGNIEYLKNKENCLFYELGNINSAIKCLEILISNTTLQDYLYQNGLDTAKKRNLNSFKQKILSLYKD